MALARSADGGASWSSPTRVHADGWAVDACPHAGPSVVADGATVAVSWPTAAPGRGGTWQAESSDGGATFGAPRALLAGPMGQVASVQDGRGRRWTAWTDPVSAHVMVHRDGVADTVRVVGDVMSLAATADGWRLAWQAPDGVRVASGS